MASAEAAIADAEFQVLKAAAELSVVAGMSAPTNADEGQLVPWAVDRPHVGAYDMKFDQLFAGKLAPPRLQLIHRTLPIGRRAIDAHGEAVVATADALDASEEEFRQGAVDYQTLAAWLDRLTAQRRAFLQSVQRYNEDIAEYAFSVAPPDANARLLASILIRQPNKSALSSTVPDRGVGGSGIGGSEVGGSGSGGSGPGGGAPMRVGSIRPASKGETGPPAFRPDEPIEDQPLFKGSGRHEPRQPRILLVQAPGGGHRPGGANAGTGAGRAPARARRRLPRRALRTAVCTRACSIARRRSGAEAGGIVALGSRIAGRFGGPGHALFGPGTGGAGCGAPAVISAYSAFAGADRPVSGADRAERIADGARAARAGFAQPAGRNGGHAAAAGGTPGGEAAGLDGHAALLAAEYDLTRLAKCRSSAPGCGRQRLRSAGLSTWPPAPRGA